MDGHVDNWAIPAHGAAVTDTNMGYRGTNDAHNIHNGHADNNNNNDINNGMVHEHRQNTHNDI